MSEAKGSGPRPMKVFVKPGSRAELVSRRLAARSKVAAKQPPPQAEVIAPGFRPRPKLDLHDRGGKIIPDLIFTNFYVGGAASWDPADIKNIDNNLSAAMSDQGLNNVLLQYFRGAPAITSTFRPSTVLTGSKPTTVSQPDVEQMVRDLQGAGKLNGFDFGNTLLNFMLPRGTILTIGDGGGDQVPAKSSRRSSGEVEEKASSLEGLGGFHGSVQIGPLILYYAVGVFSEGANGIVAFDQSWKNVVATFYHELNEARTDADVETNQVAWVNNEVPGEEIGDIPMTLAGADLIKVMLEVPLSDGSGTVPIQLMWSNAVHGPEGPIEHPHAAMLGLPGSPTTLPPPGRPPTLPSEGKKQKRSSKGGKQKRAR